MDAAVRESSPRRAPTVVSAGSGRATGVVCRSCGRHYPIDYSVCPRDGSQLGAIPTEDPLVGAIVAGSYRIVRRLARGGMGRLYEAEHLRLGKAVTLKVLHDHLASNDELVARFEREARAASRIESPHVLSVLDVARTPCGRPAIVAEYLVGRDLQRELDVNERPPLADTLSWVSAISLGLAAAHSVGVVHRDVKPANVFLCETPAGLVPKLLDFGVAKLVDEEMLTQTGAVVGTPAYMAPEQARSALRADFRSDIYSVGALLHRLCTGTTPYAPGDAAATLARILTDEPRRPRDLAPELPLAVEAIIQRAMAREPSQRFDSMQSLADAVDAVRSELVVEGVERAGAVRSLTSDAENARPLAMASAGAAILAVSATVAAVVGESVARPESHEARLLVGLAALVAGAAVTIPLTEEFRARWRSAPAVMASARATAFGAVAGLASLGLFELVSRGASALVGSPAAPSTAALALAPTVGLATFFVARHRARG